MKKLLVLLLVFALAITLVACGGDKKADTAETKEGTEKLADTEAKDDYKVKGYIDVTEENGDEFFASYEYLSEEKLDELGDYFEKNKEATKYIPYDEVEKIIGFQGIHYPEQDEVEEDGTNVKYIYWYSKDRLFYAIFVAPNDRPNDFGLDEAGVYQGEDK